jgi:hypothetical protein
MNLADGGPSRTVNFELRYRTAQNNLSEAASLTLVDMPPLIIGANFAVGQNSITLSDILTNEVHTGVGVVRGITAVFPLEETVESRWSNTLPFTWTGLQPNTTYYFRVAAKDAFFDTFGSNDFGDLNWSEVQAVTTGA